jgi:hypothetical protein
MVVGIKVVMVSSSALFLTFRIGISSLAETRSCNLVFPPSSHQRPPRSIAITVAYSGVDEV